MANAIPASGHGGRGQRGGGWRLAVWASAAVLFLLPALAAPLLPGMRWGGGDFVVWGAMVAAAAGVCDLGGRLSERLAYRAAMVVAAGTGFLLVWINLAVGFIGNEDNPANLMYVGVLAIGAIGGLLARFRAAGMARALAATALAHGVVGLVAHFAALDTRMLVLMANGVFVLAWLVSAALFRAAAVPR